MMSTITLTFVDSHQDIQHSLHIFNQDAPEHADLAVDLLRRTLYWVYDPSTATFGPSKFVGFKNMNFAMYATARSGHRTGDRFDGHATRKAIEKVLGAYEPYSTLSLRLTRWGQSLLGANVFEGLDRAWKFTSL
jgi:hypothetical protein